MKITPFLLVSTLCALYGCDSGESVRTVPYSQLADGDVLVSVDGARYTKGELERDVGIRADLQALSLEKAGALQIDALSWQFRDQALEQFVNRELLLGEAKRRRAELSNDDMLAFQETFARGLSAKMPVGFGAVETVLGKRVTAFRNSLKKDALAAKAAAAIRREAGAGAMPSDDEVRETIAAAKASNAAFAITNRMAYAIATNAWKSIVAGNDFEAVGRKLHEMNAYVSYVPACDTPDPVAAKLAKGAVTPPLQQERALTIFRANAEPGVESRYSCILFALAPIYLVESPEETRKTLFRANLEVAYKARLADLRKKADVRYPYGLNPFRER